MGKRGQPELAVLLESLGKTMEGQEVVPHGPTFYRGGSRVRWVGVDDDVVSG